MARILYPEWKVVAWRFARVFLSAFLTVVVITMNDLQNFSDLWPLVLYPAIIAGISALFKALRDKYGDKKYESFIDKFPL